MPLEADKFDKCYFIKIKLFFTALLRFLDSGLRIANVGKKHAGLFQCFATNPVGTVTSPAELKVLPKQITAMSMANDSTGQ